MTSVIMIYAQMVVNVSMYAGGAATTAAIQHVPTLVGVLITGAAMKDFYVPLIKPSDKHLLIATRVLAIVIGLLPIPFAMSMPGVLETNFFARSLRTSGAAAVTCMFFAPLLSSGRDAFGGLLLAALGATGWFLLGNPFRIDNILVAVAIPLVVMVIGHVMSGSGLVFAVEKKAVGAETQ